MCPLPSPATQGQFKVPVASVARATGSTGGLQHRRRCQQRVEPCASVAAAAPGLNQPSPATRDHPAARTAPQPARASAAAGSEADRPPLVIALMGPTASGKTALAIELAEALDLAVLSVDSRQLYRGMDVGTAKPTAAQRQRVRHELLDLRSPEQPITLQEFTALAAEAIAREHRRRGIALLVGGTGLYLQALLQGLQPPAVPPQPALRSQFAALGQVHAHRLLRLADPDAAARIMPADAVRTQRALEVLYATGRPASAQQGRVAPPWRVLELGLDPPDLAARIRRRTAALYDEGLVQETALLMRRHGGDCPLLATIGYGEARRLLGGELDLPEAIALTEQRTRRYAKRQRTWFRRRHQPLWLDAGERGGPDLLRQAVRAAGEGLA